MEKNSDHALDVEIVGFKPQDKILIASMFKVSTMRTLPYREWQVSQKKTPDCAIFDIEDREARVLLELAVMRKKGFPLITIGLGAEKPPGVDAHIQRPIRWAGILHILDTVLNKEEAPVYLSDEAPEKISAAVNQLELTEVAPWYDQNHPPKEFLTDAAVLVLDPDATAFEFISDNLMRSGFRVDHAVDVSQASKMLEERRYNCVLLEMELQNEDGMRFCKSIKQSPDRRRKTAVIILTKNRTIVDRMRGSLAGCDAFLNKPIDPIALTQTMEKFLPNWKMKS
jgi:two-component system cell cycle response regulator